MARDLSVLIPARNERWLGRTVADVLAASSEATEIIVVLDGAWPEESLPQHPRVQVVYLPESIGQRAATNLAARVSTARFVMKLDAHVSMAPGFDRVLIDAAERLGPRVAQIPAQKNLHVYDRVCRTCRKRNYQGPPDKPCDCGGPCDLEVVWKPRGGTTTTCWVVDSELHFQYGSREMRKRQVWKDDIADVMTSLGACIFIERAYFFELGGFDESVGSWGQFGQELASKVWTSGGRHVCNRGTFFSHFFRVGGVGFPYAIKGSEQEYARQYSRNLWRGNHWEGQVLPFRHVVDRFWPVAGWTKEQRDVLPDRLNARLTGHARIGDDVSGVRGPLRADADGAAPARRVVDVDADARTDFESVPLLPARSETGGQALNGLDADAPATVKAAGERFTPNASRRRDDAARDRGVLLEDGRRTGRMPSGQDKLAAPIHQGNSENGRAARGSDEEVGLAGTLTKGIVYYTDNRVDERIAQVVRERIRLDAPTFPIAVVTCESQIIDFPLDDPWHGRTWYIAMQDKRGYLTMFRQILAGLEALDTDVAFLCEHDVLYAPDHFRFMPPRSDTYYYSLSVWKVDAATGLAVTYETKQTSGLCADRQLLIRHYRERVRRVEAEGFSRRMGFEPGSHRRPERVDDVPSDVWRSAVPNVDIRHSTNLTASRWAPSEFRSQRNCRGWTEADAVPGWPGQTKGRFWEWLAEASDAAVRS